MDINYKLTLKTVLSDRSYLAVIVGMIIVALITALYVVFTVEPRDIQVTTRFTSFGETNYYKGKWYELYGFAVLALAIAASHSVLMLKFRALDHRSFGILFGIASIGVLIVGLIYSVYVIQQLAFI